MFASDSLAIYGAILIHFIFPIRHQVIVHKVAAGLFSAAAVSPGWSESVISRATVAVCSWTFDLQQLTKLSAFVGMGARRHGQEGGTWKMYKARFAAITTYTFTQKEPKSLRKHVSLA